VSVSVCVCVIYTSIHYIFTNIYKYSLYIHYVYVYTDSVPSTDRLAKKRDHQSPGAFHYRPVSISPTQLKTAIRPATIPSVSAWMGPDAVSPSPSVSTKGILKSRRTLPATFDQGNEGEEIWPLDRVPVPESGSQEEEEEEQCKQAQPVSTHKDQEFDRRIDAIISSAKHSSHGHEHPQWWSSIQFDPFRLTLRRELDCAQPWWGREARGDRMQFKPDTDTLRAKTGSDDAPVFQGGGGEGVERDQKAQEVADDGRRGWAGLGRQEATPMLGMESGPGLQGLPELGVGRGAGPHASSSSSYSMQASEQFLWLDQTERSSYSLKSHGAGLPQQGPRVSGADRAVGGPFWRRQLAPGLFRAGVINFEKSSFEWLYIVKVLGH
jgi:hypothetical protein